MQRFLIIMLCFLVAMPSIAQFSYFNSEAFWQRLQLCPPSETPDVSAGDTVLIVATNRALHKDELRYLPEERDGSRIRYFFVFSARGKWKVQPVASLQQAVELMPQPNRDWVIYTEGMGKFFTSDVDRGMNMTAQYGVNIILMDYPSITAHKKRLGNYFFARKHATIAYKDFLPVLDTIEQLKVQGALGNGHLSLFFHSMGNIVLQQIIKTQNINRYNDRVWADNLILNAACIPQRRHASLLNKVHFTQRIFINYNPGDFTLGGAYLMTKRYQLGKQVRRPLCPAATYVNFNKIAGEGHSNFLNLHDRKDIPEPARHYYQKILHGEAVNFQSMDFEATSYRHIGYDLLP